MRIEIKKKTDQLNFEDFLHGVTRDVTIAEVRPGTAEQQYDIRIEGDKRAWRPPVTVLKLLVEAWGDDATLWVGRRARLYGDPSITFGPDRLGGIRVSHVSHIDKPVTANLSKTRGKRQMHTVQPLKDEPAPAQTPEPTAEQVANCTDVATLKEMWRPSGPERRAQIEARVAELQNATNEDALPIGDDQ